MKDNITIDLSSEFITILGGDGINKKALFITELSDNGALIETLLNNCYYEKRGKVNTFKLKENSIVFHDALTGQFILHYDISYFDGCKDQHFDEEDKMLVNFEINTKECIVRLSGEELPERAPDEF